MNEYYMEKVLKLAAKGKGKVNPNPLVGAVIVKDGKIIGQGYHESFGENHAEINAFKDLSEDPKGATLYVNLEPCCHYGKTPPCAERIIERGISKVVIGMLDPNTLVRGKGIERLKSAGIEVITGVLEQESRDLNEVFIKYITTKKPFVVVKSAMSLDGKIATSSGESKWITGEESRYQVHKTRNELRAIMVGVNTVIKDDPQLTCRIKNARNPIKIIVDSTLRIPIHSQVISNAWEERIIIATTIGCNEEKRRELEMKGVEVLVIDSKDQRVDLGKLMIRLGELNIDGILVEGGATLNFSALKEKIVDKIQIYIAPKLIGGDIAKTPIGGGGIEFLNSAFKVKNMVSRFVGEDLFIEGTVG